MYTFRCSHLHLYAFIIHVEFNIDKLCTVGICHFSSALWFMMSITWCSLTIVNAEFDNVQNIVSFHVYTSDISLQFWSIVTFRFCTTQFCLLAFGHNLGRERWAMTSFRPTIWRRWMIRPPPQLFTHLMGQYKRLRLNHDREFRLGRGSRQSKSTSLRLNLKYVEIGCDQRLHYNKRHFVNRFKAFDTDLTF